MSDPIEVTVHDVTNAIILYLRQKDPAFDAVFEAHLGHVVSAANRDEALEAVAVFDQDNS